MAFASPATDPAFFGITRDHWRIVSEFARDRECVIALRTGKKAAVRWIEQRFPAKPLALKIGVDREVGLLIAGCPSERESAWSAGYPVLEPAAAPASEFVARLAGERDPFRGQRFSRPRHPWAQDGVVMDPTARLPITSDYDLAAVVDTRSFDYQGTYASMAGGPNRTNPFIDAVATELNRGFGTPRIVHGSEAQYSGSLAHRADDEILVFHPAGDVEHVEPGPVLRTDQLLHAIILRYFPDKAHVFDQ
jgi:hypothetical protein